jgi:hypothetical protein
MIEVMMRLMVFVLGVGGVAASTTVIAWRRRDCVAPAEEEAGMRCGKLKALFATVSASVPR